MMMDQATGTTNYKKWSVNEGADVSEKMTLPTPNPDHQNDGQKQTECGYKHFLKRWNNMNLIEQNKHLYF